MNTYMLFANNKVSPLVAPPSDFRNILLGRRNEICSHPSLVLRNDPDVNIWGYYLCKSLPLLWKTFLIVILPIPLLDKSLQIDLYRIYNLPALHPELKIQFTYILEGHYMAISVSGTYSAIPTVCEISYLSCKKSSIDVYMSSWLISLCPDKNPCDLLM